MSLLEQLIRKRNLVGASFRTRWRQSRLRHRRDRPLYHRPKFLLPPLQRHPRHLRKRQAPVALLLQAHRQLKLKALPQLSQLQVLQRLQLLPNLVQTLLLRPQPSHRGQQNRQAHPNQSRNVLRWHSHQRERKQFYWTRSQHLLQHREI